MASRYPECSDATSTLLLKFSEQSANHWAEIFQLAEGGNQCFFEPDREWLKRVPPKS